MLYIVEGHPSAYLYEHLGIMIGIASKKDCNLRHSFLFRSHAHPLAQPSKSSFGYMHQNTF